MSVVESVFTTLALMGGVTLAEYLVQKAYGTLKQSYFYFLELVIFVAFVVLLIESMDMVIYDPLTLYSVYFTLGFLGIVFAHTIIVLFAFHSKTVAKLAKGEASEADKLVALIQELKRKGFPQREIEKTLISAKFEKNLVSRLLVDIFTTNK